MGRSLARPLAHLEGLAGLETLNLNQTQVTDGGLKRLEGMKNLKQAHVSKSKATAQGVAALEQALPNVFVSDR
jgi:hypothetical protein